MPVRALLVLACACAGFALVACIESDELSVATATATSASADPSASVAEGETRTFRLGLTPFPHAGTPESFQEAFVFIAEHADLIAHHFDDGVPWDEALAGEAYAESFQSELDARARLSPRGALRYLAITPIAFSRDGLAPGPRRRQGLVPGGAVDRAFFR